MYHKKFNTFNKESDISLSRLEIYVLKKHWPACCGFHVFWAINCLNLFIFFCSTVKTFSKSWCVYCVCESHSLILMLEWKASVSLLWFDFFVKREKPLGVLLSDDFWILVFLCFGYSKNNTTIFFEGSKS